MRNTVERCDGCPYPGSPAIGRRGNPASGIVLIGEAPGPQESIAGQPFVGAAGKVLWSAVHDAHIPPTQVLVVNAIACQPKPVKPKVRAIDACRDRLVAEVGSYPRSVIVALGGTAVRALTRRRDFRVLRDRGQLIETPWGPMVPALHPARVLRRPEERHFLVEDLRLARDISESPREISTDRQRRLRERLRAEWIAGAEEEWRRRTGRPMTADELKRLLERYPGDV